MHKLAGMDDVAGAQDSNTNEDRKIQVYLGILLTPLPAACALFFNDAVNWMPIAMVSAVICAVTLFAHRLAPMIGDYVYSFCLVMHCILFTASLSGHPWQLDSHMLFFATLAIVSTLGRPGALLFAAGLIAVHHLSFSFLMPFLVYPGGSSIDSFWRTVMHAAIVVLETGVLLVTMNRRLADQAALEAEKNTAHATAHAVSAQQAEVDQSRKDAEHVTSVFSEKLNQMAGGDLTCRIEEPLPGKYDEFRLDFNKLGDSLHTSIGGAIDASIDFLDQSQTVMNSTSNLSTRVEKQAHALSETNQSLQSISASVQESADASVAACQNAEQAHQSVIENSKMMTATVESMAGIKESSQAVSKIIEVIEDISFQTNLLSLNAGVEAARAGESGRGFAVVANEVQALAQRTATAASEVKELIKSSGDQVEKGVELVNQVGETLDKVVTQISEANALISNISQQSREQAQGLNEMSKTLGEMDDIMYHNAAMAEEMTAVSAEMHDKSQELRTGLGHYHVETSHASHSQTRHDPSLAA